MKKKYIIIFIILIVFLSFIIPVKIQYSEIQHGSKSGSLNNNEILALYTTYEKVYFNIYNLKIWPLFNE